MNQHARVLVTHLHDAFAEVRPHFLGVVGSTADPSLNTFNDLDLVLIVDESDTLASFEHVGTCQNRAVEVVRRWWKEIGRETEVAFTPEFRLEPFARFLRRQLGHEDVLTTHLLVYPSWQTFVRWEHPSVARGLLLATRPEMVAWCAGSDESVGTSIDRLLAALPPYDPAAAIENVYQGLYLAHALVTSNWDASPELLRETGLHVLRYALRFGLAHAEGVVLLRTIDIKNALAGRPSSETAEHSLSTHPELRAIADLVWKSDATEYDLGDLMQRTLHALARMLKPV